jgi:hypothetical protein
VSARVAAPRLVLVAPGVWVVEDSPYAVYYYDGFYWRFYDGIWYRSLYYDSGFIGVNVGIVPRVVVHNYRPAHVHYRAPHTARTRAIIRDHRSDRPVVRDHRRDNRRDDRRDNRRRRR